MPRTTDKFRAAVRAAKFTEANELLVTMRNEVESEWQAASSPEQRERIAQETTGLLQWARLTILASRSHTQSKLGALNRESLYLTNRAPHKSRLELEA